MGILIAAVTFLFLLFAVKRVGWFRAEGIPGNWVSIAFLLRIAAGFALMAVYTWYYTERVDSDTWKYFDDAMRIRSWWKEDPMRVIRFLFGAGIQGEEMAVWRDQLSGWNATYTYGFPYDYRTIVRLQLLLSVFTFGHYEAHVVWMAFMGLIGSLAIYRAVLPWWPHPPAILAIIPGVLPSLIFWSSGVVKEAPAWMLTGLLFLFVSSAIRLQKMRYPVLACITLFLLFFLKPYLCLSLIPGLSALLIWHTINRKWLVPCFVGSHILILILALSPVTINPAGNLIYVLNKKHEDFRNVALETNAGSLIETSPLEGPADLFLRLPQAFATTFLRPWIGEVSNPMMALAAVENTLLLIALVVLLLNFRLPGLSSRPLWLLMWSFVLTNAIVIGYSVPVLGAVVRYRFAAFTILLITLALSANQDLFRKLKRRVRNGESVS